MSTPGTTTLLHRETPASRAVAFAAWMLAALFGMTSAAFADDDLPGRVGRVADVAGELFLAPQEQPEQWSPIGINYPVTTGDNLWAGNDGRAEVDFGAGQQPVKPPRRRRIATRRRRWPRAKAPTAQPPCRVVAPDR